MTSPSGRRAGVAIVRIEIDDETPDRTLVRVETLDDVLGGERPVQRAFPGRAEALEHVREWLERWGS